MNSSAPRGCGQLDGNRGRIAHHARDHHAARVAFETDEEVGERRDVVEVRARARVAVGLRARVGVVGIALHAELEAAKRLQWAKRRIAAEEGRVGDRAIVLVGQDHDGEVGGVAQEAGVGRVCIERVAHRAQMLFEAAAAIADEREVAECVAERARVVAVREIARGHRGGLDEVAAVARAVTAADARRADVGRGCRARAAGAEVARDDADVQIGEAVVERAEHVNHAREVGGERVLLVEHGRRVVDDEQHVELVIRDRLERCHFLEIADDDVGARARRDEDGAKNQAHGNPSG